MSCESFKVIDIQSATGTFKPDSRDEVQESVSSQHSPGDVALNLNSISLKVKDSYKNRKKLNK